MAEISRLFATSVPAAALPWLAVVALLGWLLCALLMVVTLRRGARLRALTRRVAGAEVRRGHLVECLAPLLDRFPVDPRKPGTSTVFLGRPVDYLHFDPEDGLHLIEIKSGRSQLTAKQRRLREQIESGAVRWHTLSIDS